MYCEWGHKEIFLSYVITKKMYTFNTAINMFLNQQIEKCMSGIPNSYFTSVFISSLVPKQLHVKALINAERGGFAWRNLGLSIIFSRLPKINSPTAVPFSLTWPRPDWSNTVSARSLAATLLLIMSKLRIKGLRGKLWIFMLLYTASPTSSFVARMQNMSVLHACWTQKTSFRWSFCWHHSSVIFTI